MFTPERSNQYYSSPKEAIRYTGIHYDDLKLEDEQELIDMIAEWLIEAKDLMDNYIERDFHNEVLQGTITVIPPGIHNVAKRIVANMILQAQIRKQTPIVDKDDASIDMLDSPVFTDDLKADLNLYKKLHTTYSTISMRRVRRQEEIEGDLNV